MDEIRRAIFYWEQANPGKEPTEIVISNQDYYQIMANFREVVGLMPPDTVTINGLKVIRTNDLLKGEIRIL